ncbi:MAG: hypothetical protein ACE5G3_05325 [Gammaproteobacteria bacterium]
MSARIKLSIEAGERYRISYRDAVIITAADSMGATTLFTEDLNHGQRYGNVTVNNPFV